MFIWGQCPTALFCPARGNTVEEFQAFFFFFSLSLKKSSKLGRESYSGLWTIKPLNTVDSLLVFAISGMWVRLSYHATSCLTTLFLVIQTSTDKLNLLTCQKSICEKEKLSELIIIVICISERERYLVRAITISEETVGDGAITTIGSPSNTSSHNIWIWINTGWKHLLVKGRMTNSG